MKKTIALLLTLFMLLSVVSCGNTDSIVSGEETNETIAEESTETNAEETAETITGTVYPVTVTDQAGREVTIEEKPERLVSGYYISTSTLIALNLEDKLVGIEAKANKRAIYKLSSPELIELPSVGTAKEFDLEGCAALEPDLVILPIKLKNAVETLETLGIDVLLVNPENQELLYEMIALIGEATDAGEEAKALLDFASKEEIRLTETLRDAEYPSVYLAGNSSMLSTAGEAMYQSDMIRLAGGINVASSIADTYWVEIDYEQLLAWDPEYILLASDADYTVEDVLADPNLVNCQAVKEEKVYKLPGKAEAWDSPVPSGILGSVWLSGILHPDIFSADDCAARIDEYYETFYDFKYSEN